MKEDTDEEVIKLSEEKKIGIIRLWRWSKEYYALTPEKSAEVWKGWDEIEKKFGKVKQVCGYDATGMGKFDGFAISEVTDIGDYLTYIEAGSKYWTKYMEYVEFYPGVR
jgi:hypothetical protein